MAEMALAALGGQTDWFSNPYWNMAVALLLTIALVIIGFNTASRNSFAAQQVARLMLSSSMFLGMLWLVGLVIGPMRIVRQPSWSTGFDALWAVAFAVIIIVAAVLQFYLATFQYSMLDRPASRSVFTKASVGAVLSMTIIFIFDYFVVVNFGNVSGFRYWDSAILVQSGIQFGLKLSSISMLLRKAAAAGTLCHNFRE